MNIEAVSQNPMWAAMSQMGTQSASGANGQSAVLNKTDSDGDHDGTVAGTAAVNDGDHDGKSTQQTQSPSGIDIKV